MSVYTTLWSPLLLRHIRRAVTPTPNEEFKYITGVRVADVHVPLAMLGVKYARVSVVGVDVDGLSNIQRLAFLDRNAHPLLASAHSHPGNGPDSVNPSGTDYAMHRRFEKAGYILVGLIFSRDGWLRFFSWQQAFDIEVFGHGLKQYERSLFRFTSVDQHPHSHCETREGTRATGLGDTQQGP